MAWPRIPLEDDPSDVLRKAMRGNGLDPAELARRTGLAAGAIAGWTRGQGVPGEDQARTLATVLRLDPGKFADAAARRWFPDPVVPGDVRHHPHDPHPSNGYLFFLDDGKTAALIDPAGLPRGRSRCATSSSRTNTPTIATPPPTSRGPFPTRRS